MSNSLTSATRQPGVSSFDTFYNIPQESSQGILSRTGESLSSLFLSKETKNANRAAIDAVKTAILASVADDKKDLVSKKFDLEFKTSGLFSRSTYDSGTKLTKGAVMRFTHKMDKELLGSKPSRFEKFYAENAALKTEGKNIIAADTEKEATKSAWKRVSNSPLEFSSPSGRLKQQELNAAEKKYENAWKAAGDNDTDRYAAKAIYDSEKKLIESKYPDKGQGLSTGTLNTSGEKVGLLGKIKLHAFSSPFQRKAKEQANRDAIAMVRQKMLDSIDDPYLKELAKKEFNITFGAREKKGSPLSTDAVLRFTEKIDLAIDKAISGKINHQDSALFMETISDVCSALKKGSPSETAKPIYDSVKKGISTTFQTKVSEDLKSQSSIINKDKAQFLAEGFIKYMNHQSEHESVSPLTLYNTLATLSDDDMEKKLTDFLSKNRLPFYPSTDDSDYKISLSSIAASIRSHAGQISSKIGNITNNPTSQQNFIDEAMQQSAIRDLLRAGGSATGGGGIGHQAGMAIGFILQAALGAH